jgi:hypothetical protein
MDFAVMFDRKFVVEGFVCISSILEHGTDSRVFVLNLDHVMEHVVPRILPDKRVVNISRVAVETRYPRIAATRSSRPWAPYTQSLKPFLPEYVFDIFGSKGLTYVDSDMLFWGDCGEIDHEMGDSSFMVTSREQEPPPQCGSFNGGCFSCRDDGNCRDFLAWWQERCVEWCLWKAGPDGKFGEEGYLNIIRTEPRKFAGTHVSGHPGINLAPWNVKKHRLDRNTDTFVVDQRFPLVCYHYQGMGAGKHPYVIPKDSAGREVTELYASYRDRLSAATELLKRLVPKLPLDDRSPSGDMETTR